MKKFIALLLAVLMMLTFAACTNASGSTSKTPYIQDGYWYVEGENTGIKAEGKDGQNGQDGKTPYINNGYWYIDGVSTGVKAQGEAGKTPYIQNGYWYIGGINTGVKAQGQDGKTPTIKDGYWYIDGVNTGVKAQGEAGKTPTLSISENGYWVIDGVETDYAVNADSDYLLDLLKSNFVIEKDTFVCIQETATNPSWNYTDSTFSGWGGSIGKPQEVEAVAITVRARDTEITKIKFFLNVNDHNGLLLATETLTVSIPAGETREIVWKLPQAITNNTQSLYLSYNCNSYCDLWTNFSTNANILPDEYQAYMTYSTKGNIYDSSTQMIATGGRYCRYLYAKIGKIQDVLKPKNQNEGGVVVSNKINVFLPDEYDITINDNFQLFYRGVVQAVNPYNYDITVTCTKGKAFPRYFEWTPTAEDAGKSYDLKITVRDDNGTVLGTDKTVLKVHKPKANVTKKNVLCVGDSLTQRGLWSTEAHRRFTKTGGSPAGLGYNYLNFIGTKTKDTYGNTVPGFEGHSGRHWEWMCGKESPFYDSALGDISFKSYCTKNGFSGIDIVYFLLTWNGQGVPYNTFDITKGHFVYAAKMIDTLHKEYPNAIVRCMGIQMPSQCGGMGYMYGANGGYSEDYGMLVTAMNYNAALEDFCQQSKYKSFVKYVDVAGQFDTEYNMPAADKPVNNRSEVTEKSGTDGVHPSLSGYYQIADAAFRSLCEIFKEA